MSNSPILNLPQVSPTQNQKEVPINLAFAIVEAAFNQTYIHDATGLTSLELNQDQYTRYLMHRVQDHSAPLTLWTPDTDRFFIVSNEGTADIFVKPDGSASGEVQIPAGKIVMVAVNDQTIFAVSSGVSELANLSDVDDNEAVDGMVLGFIGSEGKWKPVQLGDLGVSFTSLGETPDNYTGSALFYLRVNAAANAIEFAPFPLVPSQLGQLADVETGTGLTEGYVLTYRDGVWQAEPSLVASTFLGLTDTPASFTGQARKKVRVNVPESALEFVTDRVEVSGAKLVDYTAVAADANTVVPFNSADPKNFTIPANATVAFEVGTTLSALQMDQGQVSFVAGAGVTLNFPASGSVKSREQWSVISAIKIATNTWVVFGDMEPAA